MKRDKIIYWSATSLMVLGFVSSSMMYLSKNSELIESFNKLGYPEYFITILGIAKLAGALALVNPWWPALKEWAYAGYFFTLTGAVWTHLATETPFVAPLVFLGVTFVSYYFYKRVKEVVYKAQTV